MSEQQPVEVTQADREAAADIACMIERLAIGGNDAAAIRNGIWDSKGELAVLPQAFARHRLAHQPPSAPAQVGEVERDRDVLFEALGALLSADPGWKMAAAEGHARAVWSEIDDRS